MFWANLVRVNTGVLCLSWRKISLKLIGCHYILPFLCHDNFPLSLFKHLYKYGMFLSSDSNSNYFWVLRVLLQVIFFSLYILPHYLPGPNPYIFLPQNSTRAISIITGFHTSHLYNPNPNFLHLDELVETILKSVDIS